MLLANLGQFLSCFYVWPGLLCTEVTIKHFWISDGMLFSVEATYLTTTAGSTGGYVTLEYLTNDHIPWQCTLCSQTRSQVHRTFFLKKLTGQQSRAGNSSRKPSALLPLDFQPVASKSNSQDFATFQCGVSSQSLCNTENETPQRHNIVWSFLSKTL